MVKIQHWLKYCHSKKIQVNKKNRSGSFADNLISANLDKTHEYNLDGVDNGKCDKEHNDLSKVSDNLDRDNNKSRNSSNGSKKSGVSIAAVRRGRDDRR